MKPLTKLWKQSLMMESLSYIGVCMMSIYQSTSLLPLLEQVCGVVFWVLLFSFGSHLRFRFFNKVYVVLSLKKQLKVCDVTTGFPAKWQLVNERKISILIVCYYPDQGSASDKLCSKGNLLHPIRGSAQVWVVTHHQMTDRILFSARISGLLPLTSFCSETSVDVAKCWLFSQA